MNRTKATAYQKHASVRTRTKAQSSHGHIWGKKWERGVKICDKLEINIINKQKTQVW